MMLYIGTFLRAEERILTDADTHMPNPDMREPMMTDERVCELISSLKCFIVMYSLSRVDGMRAQAQMPI